MIPWHGQYTIWGVFPICLRVCRRSGVQGTKPGFSSPKSYLYVDQRSKIYSIYAFWLSPCNKRSEREISIINPPKKLAPVLVPKANDDTDLIPKPQPMWYWYHNHSKSHVETSTNLMLNNYIYIYDLGCQKYTDRQMRSGISKTKRSPSTLNNWLSFTFAINSTRSTEDKHAMPTSQISVWSVRFKPFYRTYRTQSTKKFVRSREYLY